MLFVSFCVFKMEIPSKGRFLISTIGIFVCYFYFAILQERITRTKFGDERFNCILSLTFLMSFVNCVFANFVRKFLLDRAEGEEDSTPGKFYALAALTYLVATVTGQKALAWISYPTQVVGKSCKPLPIMIFGVLFF